MRPKEGWYIGKFRSNIRERCWGFIRAGYWYAGGSHKEPYTHEFWGLVWRGEYTFGIGRIIHGDLEEI